MSQSDSSSEIEIVDISRQVEKETIESQECAAKLETSDNSNSSSYDASLDFYSSEFDPLRALRCNMLGPPDPTTPPCDNLAKYSSKYSWDNPASAVPSTSAQASTSKSADSSKHMQKAREELPERRWLPHQLPIIKERKQSERPNIIKRMESAGGPMQRLFQCTVERTKAKVWTRNERGIRGYCLGYVTFFDKHWNMSLEDVIEVWTRRKKQKIPAFGDISAVDQKILSRKVKTIFPAIEVIKQDKKTETCKRYINQLIIRGEHVSHIIILGDDCGS